MRVRGMQCGKKGSRLLRIPWEPGEQGAPYMQLLPLIPGSCGHSVSCVQERMVLVCRARDKLKKIPHPCTEEENFLC